MATIQNLQLEVNRNNNGTANIDVVGNVTLAPGDGDVTCNCAIFGDDPIFDDFLFRFDSLLLGNDFGTSFRFNIDKTLAELNEDRIGKDEIYAEIVISKPLSVSGPGVVVLTRRKSLTKEVPS